MAEVAKLLGTPFMPWQRQVADVGLELDPKTGLFAYREVLVSVMRQNGKTSLLLAVEVERCTMWNEAQRVVYTAQTGSDAREKLLVDQVPLLERSVLQKAVRKIHRAKGEESIFFRNGSQITLAASAAPSGHGFTVDLGVLDEAWDDEDDRREQAMLPAMNTRPMAQIWLISTQGTDKSTYLNRKTEIGRHAAIENRGSGIAYFEWSIPAEADIDNPEVWWEYMPALGWTVSEAAVAHARETMEEAEWRRAYGNQPSMVTHERVIPAALWAAVTDPRAEVKREGGPLVFGIDVLPDRSAAAVVASDGRTVELVDHRAGTGWIVERIKKLTEAWGGSVVIDDGGPATSLGDDLDGAGLKVRRLKTAELAAACARIYDAIADGKVRVRQHELLDGAVAGLARRTVGDRFIWSRSASVMDITPFMAATLAFGTSPESPTEPLVAYT